LHPFLKNGDGFIASSDGDKKLGGGLKSFKVVRNFGYLRRDPDKSGFQFWLDKLNQFDGNFERAEMVKAFLDSGEYRQRFGP